MKAYFIENEHGYYLNNIRGASCTASIARYNPTFNKAYISRCVAYKKILGEDRFLELRKKVFGFDHKPSGEFLFPLFDNICGIDVVDDTQGEVLQEWLDSGTKGTEFHKRKEAESIERGYEINPFDGKKYETIVWEKKYDNESWGDDPFDAPDGFYPEFLIWDKSLPDDKLVFGTIDKLFIETINGVRYVDSDDYKTNNKLIDSSKYQKMLSPLDYLYSNKYNTYALQASWYQLMCESHGFTCRNASFTQYENYTDKIVKTFPVKIMRREIDLIRNDIKENLGVPELMVEEIEI